MGKTIAVIGYGAQGRAQAQCMHDSGLKVVVRDFRCNAYALHRPLR